MSKETKTRQTVEVNDAIITGVTSPENIARIANAHGLNPQEVFVRVTFEYQGNEYTSSNQLRFFGEEGYNKLLEAKKSKTPVNLTIVYNEKGDLMYLESDEKVEVSSLFSKPVERKDTRTSISNLFNL